MAVFRAAAAATAATGTATGRHGRQRRRSVAAATVERAPRGDVRLASAAAGEECRR